MGYRWLVSLGAWATSLIVLWLLSVPVIAQTALRTPWGDPDLQGTWTNTTTTPMERPSELADREVLTDEERAEFDAEAIRNADRPPPPGSTGAYNNFWFERGVRTDQTSWVIDPPNGTLPLITPKEEQRIIDLALVRDSSSYPTTWEDVNIYERCITRGMPGTMMPGFYNHNYLILQTPGYVVLRTEMIHDTRVIPVDGREHIDSSIRQWLGDSRGHWEGETLVVETTNLTDKVFERRFSNTVYGTGEHMYLVERFTRVDADTIDYQFTVTDPTIFRRPWTAATPMAALDGPIFEYACHEGNYAMVNMLSGARAKEQAAAGGH